MTYGLWDMTWRRYDNMTWHHDTMTMVRHYDIHWRTMQSPYHTWHQNHVSSMLRSWVSPQLRISLLGVLLYLLQFWAFRLIWGFWKWSKMILHDQKRRTMSLAHSEAKLLPKLQFHFLKSSLTSYSPSAAFLTFRLIWGFWKWSPVIPHNPKHGVWHQNHVCSMLRS